MRSLLNRSLAKVSAIALVLFVADSALASAWAGFAESGSNSRFGWSSLDSADPTQAGHTSPEGALMGTPTISPAGFFFENANIVVDTSDTIVNAVNEWGVSTTGSNVGNISVPAMPGGSTPTPITEIIVRESGTYSSAAPLNDFQVLVTMLITPIDPPGVPALPFLPPPPFVSRSAFTADVNFNGDGTWDVELVLDVTNIAELNNAGLNTFRLDLTNQLQLTGAGISADSSITKDFASVIVPEPATGLVLLVSGVFAGLRRRR